MLASDLATNASTALTAFAGALAPLYSDATSSGTFAAAEATAVAARADVLQTLQDFGAKASTVLAVTVTWRGVSQSTVELSARLYEMANNVGNLSDTDSADAATALAAASNVYLTAGV
jgi:hypothetical protein